jgi:biopolymer transport protein ExbD
VGAVALTPMIDVVFLLMLYFLLVGEIRPADALLGLSLPEETAAREAPASSDPFALPERPVVVRIASTGSGANDARIELSEGEARSFTSIDAFGSALAGEAGEQIGRGTRMILAPGASARWEHTLRALEALRAAGFSDLTVRAAEDEGAAE